MKKNVKRSLSVLLVLIMLLGLIPTTVLADEKIDIGDTPIVPILKGYKVTYDPNGGTFLTVKGSDSSPIVKNVPANVDATAPEPVPISGQTPGSVIDPNTPVDPVRYGEMGEYQFLGWSKEQKDPEKYSDADKYDFSTPLKAHLTLYAMWGEQDEVDYATRTGSVSYYEDEDATTLVESYDLSTKFCTAIIAPASTPTKAGYSFQGWKVISVGSTSKDSAGDVQVGDVFTEKDFNKIVSPKDYKLVAEWRETGGFF